MWSRRRAPVIRRAAAFWTACTTCIATFEAAPRVIVYRTTLLVYACFTLADY